ncbi:MAG: oxidoreductase [Elusimicrobiota bacterium]
MPDKLKFAFYWTASCGGCEVAVLDIDEKILDVLEITEIVFWPVAMDIKYKDVEQFSDGYIDVCFINGAIRNSENEEIVKLLRQKSKTVVAFGSCACFGSVIGLANLNSRETIFETVYKETPATINPQNIIPQNKVRTNVRTEQMFGPNKCSGSSPNHNELTLPEFLETLKTLDEAIKVDYYLPGCPPPVKLIIDAVNAIASGKLPPAGSVLAGKKSVCDECKKEKQEKNIKEIKRVYEFKCSPRIHSGVSEANIDTEKCLLEQGIICLGPATRSGCEAKCLNANMPCNGCMGSCEGVSDQGAKMISALGSILGITDEEKLTEGQIDKIIEKIHDPIGTFYKYTLLKSLLYEIIQIRTNVRF